MSTAAPTLTAEEITHASKSNLALAFVALSPERRADMNVFYAFCRVIDDLADEEGVAPQERQRGLEAWKRWLEHAEPGEPSLAPSVRALRQKYQLTAEYFLEIIAGCEMDLLSTKYETWEELRLYCYRVASAVGLVSIEIFGYRDPACRQYAIELGLALQLTNIMRDVGEDWQNGGRIYLPREEMARSGFTVEDLAASRESPAWQLLIRQQAERAEALFAAAVAALPSGERRSMVAAEIMRTVYYRLLGKMRADGFRSLTRRYRLSKPTKLWVVAQVLWRTWRKGSQP